MEAKPLVPQDIQNRELRAKVFPRACLALLTRQADPKGPEAVEIARQRWEVQPRIARLVRAAVAPNSTTDTSALLAESFSNFLGSLAPVSAAAQLMSRGLDLGAMPGLAEANVPWLSTPPDLSWVAELDAFPVIDATVASLSVTPKNARFGFAMTRKLLQSSNGEAIFTALLRNATAKALDKALFVSTAGSATRPPGLLAGVTPIAATSSLGGDLRALTDAVVAAGGGQDVVFITSPGRALAAGVLSNTPLPIYGSAALAGTQLVAIDCAGFFFSVVPEIRTSTMSTLHMDSTPLPLISGSGTVAAPVRDLFQTASVRIQRRAYSRLGDPERPGATDQQSSMVSAMSENRPGRSVGNNAAMQAQLTEELAQRWGGWIDARIAAAMAAAVATVAESVGEAIARERQRSQDAIKGAIACARLEIRAEILEARSATLEGVSARLDRHFDSLLHTISVGLTVRDDAGALLRRLPALTSTRQ